MSVRFGGNINARPKLAASHLSWTANGRPRPSLPCPDACNLAFVFNHGVLSLLCGGSSKHFFLGSRDVLIPSCQGSYDQGRLGVQLRATGGEQYAGRKCDSRTPKTGSGCLELPIMGIRSERQQSPPTNRLGYCRAVARPIIRSPNDHWTDPGNQCHRYADG